MFDLHPKSLNPTDVAVIGGGIAGLSAAVIAARQGASVTLIEADGCLGGIMTNSTIPLVLDKEGKGGIIRELYDFLEEKDMCCPRRGPRRDESGRNRPGALLDAEGAKYFFDRLCTEAGVRILCHSRVIAAETADSRITHLLLSTACGLYSLPVTIAIDASGNGDVAAMVGCNWECGEPATGQISPASLGTVVSGMPADYTGTEGEEAKTAYGAMLRAYGITTSTSQASVVKLPQPGLWGMGVNFEYDVHPEDIESLSRATVDGRRESFEVIDAHKKIPGYEALTLVYSSAHLGCREGRRIYGVYRLTDEDILAGRRFEDGICLVRANVDVHKLSMDDTLNCSRGYRSKPYHIPYRCLLPLGCENLLLAGRCISGDFYPHSSYRMMGNMAATGEAAGYAAAACIRDAIPPAAVDGKAVSAFMQSRGYEL